jgi:restriction system protein
MIENIPPSDWRDLQERVALILRESGFTVEIERVLPLARGSASVDVLAHDSESVPPVLIVCECKHWRNPVHQGVVHAFRTIVVDSGANLGIIISSAGFQSGAISSAAFSNVQLKTWEGFQELLEDRWYLKYMVPVLRAELDPLIEYTEPVNSRIFRKADSLPVGKRETFNLLRSRHLHLGCGLLPLLYPFPTLTDRPVRPTLPLRTSLGRTLGDDFPPLPEDILDATALRQLLAATSEHSRAAIAEFDDLFGERA